MMTIDVARAAQTDRNYLVPMIRNLTGKATAPSVMLAGTDGNLTRSYRFVIESARHFPCWALD